MSRPNCHYGISRAELFRRFNAERCHDGGVVVATEQEVERQKRQALDRMQADMQSRCPFCGESPELQTVLNPETNFRVCQECNRGWHNG